MFAFLEKINPLNWIEGFVIKRIAKKMKKAIPLLKEKGDEYIEEHKDAIIQKVKVAVFEYLQKRANKQK